MQILLAEEMRALDRAAEEEIGIPGLVKSSSLPAKATTAATAAAPAAGSTTGARR